MLHDDDDDDGGGIRRYKEWECPDCNAHNPADDGFTFGDELFCNYCGQSFEVKERNGKPRFVES